jgi:hypothetical protein
MALNGVSPEVHDLHEQWIELDSARRRLDAAVAALDEQSRADYYDLIRRYDARMRQAELQARNGANGRWRSGT